MSKYPALKNHYELDKTIGCGGFAKVKLATHLPTGEKVAIKIMEKEALKEDLPRVEHEIKALKSLSHPNICKLYEIIETETHYFLVIEYCSGGELFDHIVEKQKLNEREARYFFRQIISAVSYLHNQGFAHRDLKPENILLDKDQNLKLIDFGLCIKPDGGLYSRLQTSCGSPSYAAPELVLGEEYLGTQVDIWSLGVLLYALLCGTLPFDDENVSTLYKQIIKGDFLEPKWLSLESRLLIRSLLQHDPMKRITTDALCCHPWVMKGFNTTVINYQNIDQIERDDECLSVLSQYYHKSNEQLWNELKQLKYDNATATYFILQSRKRNDLSLKLLKNPVRKRIISASSSSSCEKTDEPATPSTTRTINTRIKNMNTTYTKPKQSDVENISRVSTRRGSKRTRSPNAEIKSSAKRTRSPHSNSKSGVPMKTITNKNRNPVVPDHIEPQMKTPSSARRVLDGIEKGFNMARLILTPRRRSSVPCTPVTLNKRELCNVSTTSSTSPDQILDNLKQVLDNKGIIYSQRGYTLRGKVRQPANEGKATPSAVCKLSFELEVCWVPEPCLTPTRSKKSHIVGIRRKRLKGDVWIYKSICEDVLAMTSSTAPVRCSPRLARSAYV